MFIKDKSGCLYNSDYIKKIYKVIYPPYKLMDIFAVTTEDITIVLKNDLSEKESEEEMYKLEDILNNKRR